MNPIISQLQDRFGSSVASSLLDTIRVDYSKTLAKLQSAFEAKDLRRLTGIESFRASPISSDGKLLLYRFADHPAKGDCPQPEDNTILVAVHDLERDIRIRVLGDQSAIITWTGFSPDDKRIATMARGALRIYDTMSGECKQEVSLPDGRYRGTWAPDSKHVLLYGMMREINNEKHTVSQSAYMAVYSTKTGEKIAQYTHNNLSRGPDPIVTAWSPRDEIAIASETHIWIWRPFENVTLASLTVKIENPLMRMFAHFIDLMWVDEGRTLIAKNKSGTIEVWDQDKNVKWRLQRPQGPALTRSANDCYWFEDSETLVSLDMDASLRFYNL